MSPPKHEGGSWAISHGPRQAAHPGTVRSHTGGGRTNAEIDGRWKQSWQFALRARWGIVRPSRGEGERERARARRRLGGGARRLLSVYLDSDDAPQDTSVGGGGEWNIKSENNDGIAPVTVKILFNNLTSPYETIDIQTVTSGGGMQP